MPMITLQVAADGSDGLAQELARTVARLTAEILGKDPHVTAVAVGFVPPRRWFIADRTSEQHGRPAFFLDVRITDGTNTKEEKARFVAAAFAALSALLGGAHVESYVHVDDVRADGYGYGGRTQERRFVEREMASPSLRA
ncbi:MAG: tautomerase family protein [Myxococcales bacterium]|nr:tautomerase family protein [Myxococcales bacterium]